MPLMSIRAYARLRGLRSDNVLHKAIATGKIPLVSGMIDPEIADAAWARNRDPGQESKLAAAAPPFPSTGATSGDARSPQSVPEAAAPLEAAPIQQELPPIAPLTAARIR